MKNLLTDLLRQEKRRQLILSLAAAVIIALLILAISFGLNTILNHPSDGSNPDNNNSNNSNQAYVLSLSSKLDHEFQNAGIVGFTIAGNITTAIHPRLITSEVRPNGTDNWLVDAWVLNATTMDPMSPYQANFTFSNQAMLTTHNIFVHDLNQTHEVDKTEYPSDSGSIPNLLFYRVYFADHNMTEFVWAGFTNVDIMQVQHYTWRGDINQPTLYLGEEHYVAPLSAFDPFISQLQQLYSTILGD